MTISMYQASIPLLIRGLTQLSHILDKGEKHAQEHNIDPLVLTSARLFPDMLPLTAQVQIAADISKGCGARLSGTQPPSFDDTEKSFEELKARIEKTIAFLKECKAEDIDGSEEREIELKLRTSTFQFSGQGYLTMFVLPNVYFHITTTYNILRHNGVNLGKVDYVGGA